VIEYAGDYPQMYQTLLAGTDRSFRAWAVVDGDFPDGPEAADAWLISGSRFSSFEDLPWIHRLLALVRDIVASGRPLVGICFGHQIIARAMGGTVERFAGGWAVGRQTYDWQGTPVAMNAWHQDQVTALPQGARVLASNDFCRNAVIAYGDHVLTVQAHPEFDGAIVERLIASRGRGLIDDNLLDAAGANLNRPDDSGDVARRLGDFLSREAAHV